MWNKSITLVKKNYFSIKLARVNNLIVQSLVMVDEKRRYEKGVAALTISERKNNSKIRLA